MENTINKININGSTYELDILIEDKSIRDVVSSLTDSVGNAANSVKVGSTSYNSSNGVVSLPEYPTTLPASDVSAWAKAASKPTYTASEVGLGDVGNFKAVSTVANQGLSTTEQSNARANIGAGTSNFSGDYNDLLNKPTIVPYYGIRWTDTNTAPIRIGNMELHKTLPIQSLMRRCMVTDSGEVRYIHPDTPLYYVNGDSVDYTGKDGQFMVEIPEYPYEVITSTSDGVTTYELRLYTSYTFASKKSKKVYIGAVEASSDDASDATTPKLYSIVTTEIPQSGTISADSLTYIADAGIYRGGNARGTSTNDTNTNSLLGRPVTNLTRAGFRTRAAARGAGWSQQYWDALMAFTRLYVVEYCSFDSQAEYNESLTTDGFKQGGLGSGVSIVNSSYWSAFNGNNPIVPCGTTIRLGNKTGIVPYTVTITNPYTLNVPSYRGIENPFGHIWKFTDGVNIYGDANANKSSIYTCSDITKFADNTSDNYILRTANATYGTGGYIKIMNIDEVGDFLPTWHGGSSDSYYHDYCWFQNPGWKILISGGYASSEAACGLFCFVAGDGSGLAWAAYGGRLCYTPS